jgi:hypothetical protein
MKSVLSQPFPFDSAPIKKLGISVFAGFLIFIVLYFFKPFGINLISNHSVLWVTLMYGLATAIVAVFCNMALPIVLPKYLNEKKWTVGKEILLTLLIVMLVTAANLAISTLWLNVSFTIALLGNMFKYTILLSLLPISVIVILKQQLLLYKYKKEASNISNTITVETTKQLLSDLKIEPTKKIMIRGTNANELLEIDAKHFVVAEAADNYTQIHYLKSEKLHTVMYRTTITNLINCCKEVPFIYRCHRSYLVNLTHVHDISGNAQGYRLHIEKEQEFLVPVSRNLNAIIKTLLAQYANLG